MANSSLAFDCPAPFYNVEHFGTGGFVDGRICAPQPTGVTCCLPCPMTEWVYPESFQTITTAADWTSVGSTLCCVILLLSWLVLPVEKTHRHYLSISLTAAVMILNMGFIIPLAAKPNQCFDAITPNDMHTSSACASSGIFLIVGGWAGVLWVFLRALSLHLQICWQVVVGRPFMIASQLVGWGIPLIGIVLVLTLSGMSYRFGATCHVNHHNSLADLWIPLLTFAAITIIIQFTTFAYVIKVYLASLADDTSPTGDSGLPSYTSSVRTMSPKQALARVKRVIQLQWRGITIVLVIVTDVVLLAIIFVLQDRTLEQVRVDPSIGMPWITCMLISQGDKTKCFEAASGLAVNQSIVGAVLLLLAMNGIWLLLFLGRWSMATGWWELIVSGPLRKKREFVSADARLDDLKKDALSPSPSMSNQHQHQLPHHHQQQLSYSTTTSPQMGSMSPPPQNAYQALHTSKSVVNTPNLDGVSPPTSQSGRRTPDYFQNGQTTRYHAPMRSFSSPRPPTAGSFDGGASMNQDSRLPPHFAPSPVSEFDDEDEKEYQIRNQHPLGMNKF